MQRPKKVNLFGLVRLIPGRNKISIIPHEGLPPGVHITLHFGGASGIMDLHLTHEVTKKHATLLTIRKDAFENWMQSILFKIFQSKLQTLDEVRECFEMVFIFPSEGSTAGFALEAAMMKFSPPRTVRGTYRLLEEGVETLFSNEDFQDEISPLIEVQEISDFSPPEGSSGLLISSDGKTTGFNAINTELFLLNGTSSIQEFSPEAILGPKLWSEITQRFNAIIQDFSS